VTTSREGVQAEGISGRESVGEGKGSPWHLVEKELANGGDARQELGCSLAV